MMGNLDRERWDSYDLTIKVQDGGSPPRASSALLRVTVLDTNDNAPKFERPSYEAELSENSPIGHSVIQVKANDSDQGANAEIDYTFHQAPEVVRRLLRLDRNTGLITVQGPVDREDLSTLRFSVLAKDRGANPKSARAQVVVTVKDMNDNAPTIEIGIGLVTHQDGMANISEDVAEETAVALVQVSDRDEGENAAVTCVVAGDVPFQLRQASETGSDSKKKYFLQTTTPLDYEKVKDYTIEIVAVDSGNPPLSSTNSLKVQVVDVNDNAPVFTQSITEVAFPENNKPGEVVAEVTASDADSGSNAELVYSLEPEPAAKGLFTISPETGEIRVKTSLDREQRDSYELKVVAADRGSPSLQGTATVLVNVLDCNDNDPKFMLSGYNFGLQKSLKFNLMSDAPGDSPRIHLPLNYPPGSPDLGRHYRSNSPLPSIQLQPQSPSASKKHQVVQDLPPANTFVGTGDTTSTGSEQYSDYSYRTNPPKYPSKQVGQPLRLSTPRPLPHPYHGAIWTEVWE
uniref:Cadherin domain-containing protein n=1 Tax=Loxodonta africana TaxID=9785 RepID=G3UEF6_LOXAF